MDLNRFSIFGREKINVKHRQLQMGCSKLNSHLHVHHVLENPNCACGADIVGMCKIEPSDAYKGREILFDYAIAIGGRMNYKEFQTVPSEASAIECVRIYHRLGEVIIELADYIRSIGYECEIEHPIGDSNLLHIPIGLKAGFGELGRHGVWESKQPSNSITAYTQIHEDTTSFI